MTKRPSRAPGLLPDEGGILVVDKPVGPTSHDVVSRVRRAISDRRIGHTGTLDPLASGVLVLCAGPATRLSQFLVGADKRYTTTLRLGIETDSLDADGEVISEDDGWRTLSTEQVHAAAADLAGPQLQVPPVFSAKKVDGERAHRKARRGEDVELEAVPVTVHSLEVLRVDLPEVDLAMEVSSGTFVRALARDLARVLGTCGHVTALRRTRSGAFDLNAAVELETIEEDATAVSWVSPLESLAHLPLVQLDAEEARRLAMGQRLAWDGAEGMVRVAYDGRLLAVAEVARGALRPRKVFMAPEVAAS